MQKYASLIDLSAQKKQTFFNFDPVDVEVPIIKPYTMVNTRPVKKRKTKKIVRRSKNEGEESSLQGSSIRQLDIILD